MSELLGATKTLSGAWLQALSHTARQQSGRCVHLVMTIENPGSEDEAIRHALDQALNETDTPGVETVAGTFFPKTLYQSPGFSWSPDLDEPDIGTLDTAARNLYQRYEQMLPVLLRFPQDIEITSSESGAPSVALRGSAAKQAGSLGISKFHISASHENGWATAIAVASAKTGQMDSEVPHQRKDRS